MPPPDLIVIILGLLISGTWLIYKLDGFQWLQKIDDLKGIVVPSLIFLLSPFLAVWIMPTLTSGDIDEIIKPVIPLATFILGQVIAKREKEKEIKQQKIALTMMIIYNVATNVMESLSGIEGQLMASFRDTEENVVIIDEIKLLLKEFELKMEKLELKMEKLHEKLSFQLDVIEVNSIIETLSYIEKIKREIKGIESIQLTPEDRLKSLADIRKYIVEGYANVIVLLKELMPDNESIHMSFLENCASKLNLERERLVRLKTRKWNVKLRSEYGIDAEGEAIEAIDELLKISDMPITTVNLNSRNQ